MPGQKISPEILRARLIALGSETSDLSSPSKMPGYCLPLPAKNCLRGRDLRLIPGTVCSLCYARTRFYETRDYVVAAHRKRLEQLTQPEWVWAMSTLINFYAKQGEHFFRWHDSGDLQGVWHLANIVKVCLQTPQVKHWLPTHEPYMVLEYLEGVKAGKYPPIPENLRLRISADYIGKPPEKIAGLEGIATHTARYGYGDWNIVQVSSNPRDSHGCRAHDNAKKKGDAGNCGKCRACWGKIPNVCFAIPPGKGIIQLDLFGK
jgi:hypothetical protein